MLSEEGAATSTAARSRRRFFASRTSSSPPTTCETTGLVGDPSSSASMDIASRRAVGSPACPGSCRGFPAFQGSPRRSASSRSSPPSRPPTRRRAHDEHGRRRRPRPRMRPDALAGCGRGCLAPGLDVQLNNLLGESDIAYGDPQPGDHLESRMAPSLAFDGEGLALAIGAAGATRLRTALATVLAGDPRRGSRSRDCRFAAARPPHRRSRRCRAGSRRGALANSRSRGRTVRRWERVHHYFGGVSCVGRAGAAGDPRRSGAAIVL